MILNKLERQYFIENNPLKIAKDLIGRSLYTNLNNKKTSGIIVETEIYRGGEKDTASHAHFLKNTKRTNIMFKEGGYCYIYLIYGLYYQFCITTSGKNKPDAILIRALEPQYGIEIMEKRKGGKQNLTNGPGRLTKSMGITKDLHEKSIISNKIWISKNKVYKHIKIEKTERIGIDYASEYSKALLWRFYLKGNKFISKK